MPSVIAFDKYGGADHAVASGRAVVAGKNTLEVTISNAAPQGTAGALNIDLILKTN